MQYLTTKEYAGLHGVSRQAIEDRIRRKTLPVVIRKFSVEKKMIPIEDTEYEKLKNKL
jgi:predicted DNA-binding protein YlxM (UPF0122 family)